MRPFTVTIAARGSLLIGGGDVPDGLHGAHVRGHDGRPIVPASALRGALRETLEALLRGADRPACEAGRGHAPGADPEDDDAPAHPCALDAGGPCATCRLFGGGRESLLEGCRDFSALVIGDGTLAEPGAHAWMLRPGVAVGRRQRSAEENRLFLRRTTATGAVFVAEGWLRDDTLTREFAAAVRATTHIGSGRSRGAARVDLTLAWKEPTAKPSRVLHEGDVVVRVTLRAPTLLGVPLAHPNLRDTRREIPGAALRGAVGFALANELPDPDQDAAFQALVKEDTGARFGFLSPVDVAVGDSAPPSREPAGRLPATSQVCKLHEKEHGLHDDLFDRIGVALITEVTQVAAAVKGLRADRCGECKGPLRGAKGYRRFKGEPRLRVVTRASIERSTASVRDGALFTEVYLEPGNVFEGTLRHIPTEAREMLARGLALPLSIGRGRGAGRGQALVEVLEVASRRSVTVRGERFEKELTRHLRASQLPIERARSLVALTLLSPCELALNGGDEWSALREALPEALRAATLLVSARRFVREGSWDQRTGKMHASQAIAAGAVYVLELAERKGWREVEVVQALETLEREGIGARRHQGYGDVVAFDPIHSDDAVRAIKQKDEAMPEGEAERRKKLVVAAEQVMGDWAKQQSPRNNDAWKVEKSQLNQLIGVCGEALCTEEIENYLRYQASRERPSWGLDLVERTIKGIEPALVGLTEDRLRVEVWRHYAVFLARAYTYRKKVTGGGEQRDRVR